MLQNIYRQFVFIIIPVSIISLFFADWRFALSIFIGAVIGVYNLRGITWSVQSLLGTEKARVKMLALSFFRLIVVLSILTVLIILKLINVYGILIGFTLVLILILREGLKASRNISQDA